jgi:Ca-activated chloride channel family protein
LALLRFCIILTALACTGFAAPDLVVIPVSVVDPLNRFVTGLERQHFKILENGTEQSMSQFLSEDAPLAVSVVLDIRTDANLPNAKEAVAEFMRASRAINTAIDSLGTAQNVRKAVLVLSDADDEPAGVDLRSTGVPVYAVRIVETGAVPNPGALARVADQTGGRYFAVSSPREFSEVIVKIGVELANQYVLAYRSAGIAGRAFRVELVPPRALPPLRAVFQQPH